MDRPRFGAQKGGQANKEKRMLIPHGTVIALADGQKFRLLRNGGTEAEPELSEIGRASCRERV